MTRPEHRAFPPSPTDAFSFGSSTQPGGNTEPAGSSKTASTNGHAPTYSVSTPTIPSEIDWSRLSPRAQAILRTIAIPISAGYSPGEVANMLGTSTSWVSNRMLELRREIEVRASPDIADIL